MLVGVAGGTRLRMVRRRCSRVPWLDWHVAETTWTAFSCVAVTELGDYVA